MALGGGGIGGGMVSTPAQLLQTSLLCDRMGVGGGHGKHTRSTAADQPALLPDYKTTWFWVGGFGGGLHMRSAAADQPARFPEFKITWFWGVGGGMVSTPAQLLQTSLFFLPD